MRVCALHCRTRGDNGIEVIAVVTRLLVLLRLQPQQQVYGPLEVVLGGLEGLALAVQPLCKLQEQLCFLPAARCVLLLDTQQSHSAVRDPSILLLYFMYLCTSAVAPTALLTVPGTRDPPLCVSAQDFFLAD